MKPQICKQLEAGGINSWVKSHNNSIENKKRSLSVLYSYSPMGKWKYVALRSAMRGYHQTKALGNLLPYAKLAKFIQSIPIGTVYDVAPKYTKDINAPDTTGCYRPAKEFLCWLASFYLTVNKTRRDKLKVFPKYEQSKHDPESFVFILAIGADGAPICGTTVLVSFLNVGERLPSSMETWTLFGADCGETSPTISAYIRYLFCDIVELGKFN